MNHSLTHLFQYITETHQSFGELYMYAHSQDSLPPMIEELLKDAQLEKNSENILAVLNRVIGLREDTLVQALESAGKSGDEITLIKRTMYEKVREIYHDRHKALLDYVQKHELLSPFYIELLKGVHEIGLTLGQWQPKWTEHIIDTINPNLEREFGSTHAIMQNLRKNKLLEYESNGQEAERSYSVLVPKGDSFEVKSYASAFPDEVRALLEAFARLITNIQRYEDNQFDKKSQWIEYFKALQDAFGEKNLDKLMDRWREVDRKWMQLDTPLQVGHPLEYYEDHYRKAVALEWDVRISNPNAANQDALKEQIKSMFCLTCKDLGVENLPMYSATLASLDKTQLYIGRPMLYYGAELNGLFSAQVVPNDEVVSSQWGKKIFAFADNVLDSIRAKPFLKIHTQVFGSEFMDHERRLIFKEPQMWHHVYAVTTIGHEFGHVLWVDDSTESIMNSSGVFKNIEEFKATLGGLVSFFENDGDKEIASYVLSDTIKRAVGLIGWMKTGEVEPYYCEGLMHLHGLFESGVLEYENEALHVSMHKYESAKEWYQKIYRDLALCYANKKDAKEFLDKYIQKDSNGIFWPNDPKVREFVEFYWALYQRMGRSVEDESEKKRWL
jgi:hypothetical protein